LPDASSLTANPKLSDPLTFFDGTKVTTRDQWECRCQEILAMAANYNSDPVSTNTDEVTVTVSGGAVSMIKVLGCSGCGKGVYLAGVFSRAPLIVIVASGRGGAANVHQPEWLCHCAGKSVWKCADFLRSC